MFFQKGAKVVKFDFTHSKLRKRPFFAKNLIGKCQISNSGEGQDAHGCSYYQLQLCIGPSGVVFG